VAAVGDFVVCAAELLVKTTIVRRRSNGNFIICTVVCWLYPGPGGVAREQER
jgi:hypothetical protein